MDLFKMITLFGAIQCVGIKNTSPHTLYSTLLMKRYHAIEENEKFVLFWDSHRRFQKVLLSNLAIVIFGQLLANNGFVQNDKIIWSYIMCTNQKYITTHLESDSHNIKLSYHWRKRNMKSIFIRIVCVCEKLNAYGTLLSVQMQTHIGVSK